MSSIADFLGENWKLLVGFFLGGSGILGYLKWFLDWEGQKHDIAKDIRDELRQDYENLKGEVQRYEGRVETLEQELQRERQLRIEAQLVNARLQLQVEKLVQDVNRLRQNQGLDPLDIQPIEADIDEPRGAD